MKIFIEVFEIVADNYNREAMNRFANGQGSPESILINYMEVVMRKVRYLVLAVFCFGILYAQPILKEPAYSKVAGLVSSHPTFKWSKVSTATFGYEIYITSTATDTSSTTIPLAATLGKSKRYVLKNSTVGGLIANDTTYAYSDTSLVANTTYFWKVRTKTAAATWSAWSKFFIFKTPTAFLAVTSPTTGDDLTIGSHYVVWTNSTGVAVTKIKLSYDGGTTYADSLVVNKSSTTDSAAFDFQGKKTATGTCYVSIYSSLDTGKSASFSVKTRAVAVTSPTTGDDLTIGSHYVVWTNNTGTAVTKLKVSYDGGSSYADSAAVNSTAAKDSAAFDFQGRKTVAGTCYAIVYNSQDTGKSASFSVKARALAVTSPTTGDDLTIGSHYVVWTNNTGTAVTKLKVSYDGGTTYADSATVNSTAAKDSATFDFQGRKTATGTCYAIVYNSQDTGKSASFSVNTRAIAVTKPASGALSLGSSYIVWTNNTGAAVAKIKVSYDGGTTYTDSVTNTSSAVKDSVLFSFGKSSSAPSCYVLVYNSNDTGKSASFSLAAGGATFSMPAVYGDPASEVWVSLMATDFLSGDSIKAFDVKVTFDSSKVHYTGTYTFDSKLTGGKWNTIIDSVHAAGANGSRVRVAGFKGTTGAGIKSSELIKLKFMINNDQTLISQVATLTIKNATLSAAGSNAQSLSVSNSTNGSITVYSSVDGNISYMHERYDGSASVTISGDSLISYTDKAKSSNDATFGITNGYYKMGSREPNDTIVITPSASKYFAAGWTEISSVDAQLAFRDGWDIGDTLSVRAKIAADINEDSLVNTTDAMAIMQISVDSTYLSTVLAKSNWIFVDSTSLWNFESTNDSLTSWYTQHQHSLTSKLTNQQTHQDFFGVLRGDVDFSYGADDVATMKKSNTTPVLFNTDATFNLRTGDEVWIPLNIYPGEYSVGGFNASMNIDPNVLTYTGEFKMGQSVPQDKNWYVAAKSDSKGTLRVAATDFSLKMTPITQDGAALLFKYIVNKDAKLGSTSLINIKTQTVIDNNMQKMSSTVSSGKVEITRMGSAVVTNYELLQNYPNPFNPSTTIEYALPKESSVKIEIYNMLGQSVATLFTGNQSTGYHQVEWNASRLGSGVYLYSITATSMTDGQTFRSVKKMVLMK